IIMENLPPPNGNQHAPEEEPFVDQAPIDVDGFAPHWFGRVANGSSDAPKATMTVPSTYEVGGPSTAPIEGPSFPLPVPRLPMPPTVIEDLDTRLGNLKYKHGVVTRKMEEVSDVVVANSIAIGEIHPRVATVGEQTALRETELQNQQLRTRLAKLESHIGIVMPYMLWMEERLTVLEKRLPGPPPGP
nr:hypothetical protein [Tanacetum cinerariifolium]